MNRAAPVRKRFSPVSPDRFLTVAALKELLVHESFLAPLCLAGDFRECHQVMASRIDILHRHRGEKGIVPANPRAEATARPYSS